MSSKISHLLDRGGLAQLTSLKGGSKTRSAFSYLDDPPSSFNGPAYYFWAADGGWLNAEALHHLGRVPLDRLLVVRLAEPREVWRVGLEAVQTGLFLWVLLRPSRPCEPVFLRKLQLAAEKTRCRVFLLCEQRLPHWTLTASLEANHETNPLLESGGHDRAARGGGVLPDSQGLRLRKA